MSEEPEKINLDAYSTVALNDLLSQVMTRLRERDARDLKKDFVTKSQRMTLQDTLKKHASKTHSK